MISDLPVNIIKTDKTSGLQSSAGLQVLIADDHSLILEGFIRILQNLPEVRTIDTFSVGSSVCKALKTKRYDVYIIDMKLPDMDGFELIGFIRAAHPEAKILVCTMVEDTWLVNKMIQSNLDGIVFKNSSVAHIGQAVKSIAIGEKYFCPRFTQIKKQYEAHRKKIGTRTMNLTHRELEVLGYITEGMTSLEIAEKMKISDNAVEGFRKNLFEKTGVRNVAQLVAWAYENKLTGKK